MYVHVLCVLVHSAHVYYIPQINLFGSRLEGEVELRIRTSPDNLNEEITPFVCMDLGLVNWRDSSCLSREN